MPVTDAYATVTEYRAAVKMTDTANDDVITTDLIAISRWLDKKLGRFFTKDAADVARTFYPRNMSHYTPRLDWAESENPFLYGGYSRWLFIDDLSAAPTSVIVDLNISGAFEDAAWATTDYELFPANAPLGPEPQPYTAIYVPNWSTQGGFPTRARVQVTGKWGWPSVPAAIQQATIEFCAIKRLDSPRASSRINELDQVVSTSAQAQNIIRELQAQYMKKESLV